MTIQAENEGLGLLVMQKALTQLFSLSFFVSFFFDPSLLPFLFLTVCMGMFVNVQEYMYACGSHRVTFGVIP